MVDTSLDELTDSQIVLRVQRLELTVAALQNTDLVEERIVERVTRRLSREGAKPAADEGSNGPIADIPAESIADVGVPPPAKTTWLLAELWSDVRTYGRLLFDHRYRVSLLGWLGPLTIAMIYVIVLFIIGGWFIVGGILERVIDFFLAILLYKICEREVHRYRGQFPKQ